MGPASTTFGRSAHKIYKDTSYENGLLLHVPSSSISDSITSITDENGNACQIIRPINAPTDIIINSDKSIKYNYACVTGQSTKRLGYYGFTIQFDMSLGTFTQTSGTDLTIDGDRNEIVLFSLGPHDMSNPGDVIIHSQKITLMIIDFYLYVEYTEPKDIGLTNKRTMIRLYNVNDFLDRRIHTFSFMPLSTGMKIKAYVTPIDNPNNISDNNIMAEAIIPNIEGIYTDNVDDLYAYTQAYDVGFPLFDINGDDDIYLEVSKDHLVNYLNNVDGYTMVFNKPGELDPSHKYYLNMFGQNVIGKYQPRVDATALERLDFHTDFTPIEFLINSAGEWGKENTTKVNVRILDPIDPKYKYLDGLKIVKANKLATTKNSRMIYRHNSYIHAYYYQQYNLPNNSHLSNDMQKYYNEKPRLIFKLLEPGTYVFEFNAGITTQSTEDPLSNFATANDKATDVTVEILHRDSKINQSNKGYEPRILQEYDYTLDYDSFGKITCKFTINEQSWLSLRINDQIGDRRGSIGIDNVIIYRTENNVITPSYRYSVGGPYITTYNDSSIHPNMINIYDIKLFDLPLFISEKEYLDLLSPSGSDIEGPQGNIGSSVTFDNITKIADLDVGYIDLLSFKYKNNFCNKELNYIYSTEDFANLNSSRIKFRYYNDIIEEHELKLSTRTYAGETIPILYYDIDDTKQFVISYHALSNGPATNYGFSLYNMPEDIAEAKLYLKDTRTVIDAINSLILTTEDSRKHLVETVDHEITYVPDPKISITDIPEKTDHKLDVMGEVLSNLQEYYKAYLGSLGIAYNDNDNLDELIYRSMKTPNVSQSNITYFLNEDIWLYPGDRYSLYIDPSLLTRDNYYKQSYENNINKFGSKETILNMYNVKFESFTDDIKIDGNTIVNHVCIRCQENFTEFKRDINYKSSKLSVAVLDDGRIEFVNTGGTIITIPARNSEYEHKYYSASDSRWKRNRVIRADKASPDEYGFTITNSGWYANAAITDFIRINPETKCSIRTGSPAGIAFFNSSKQEVQWCADVTEAIAPYDAAYVVFSTYAYNEPAIIRYVTNASEISATYYNPVDITTNYFNYGGIKTSNYSFIRSTDSYRSYEDDLTILRPTDTTVYLANDVIWYNNTDNKFYVHIDFRHIISHNKDEDKYWIDNNIGSVYIKYPDDDKYTLIMDNYYTEYESDISDEWTYRDYQKIINGIDIELRDQDIINNLSLGSKYTFSIKVVDREGNVEVQYYNILHVLDKTNILFMYDSSIGGNVWNGYGYSSQYIPVTGGATIEFYPSNVTTSNIELLQYTDMNNQRQTPVVNKNTTVKLNANTKYVKLNMWDNPCNLPEFIYINGIRFILIPVTRGNINDTTALSYSIT